MISVRDTDDWDLDTNVQGNDRAPPGITGSDLPSPALEAVAARLCHGAGQTMCGVLVDRYAGELVGRYALSGVLVDRCEGVLVVR